jgi:hypothetical protein
MSHPDDKRKESRTVHRAVVIMPYGIGEDLAFEEALLIDCSPNGVCIRLHRQLEPGSPFLLKLKHRRIMLIVYNVKHCRLIDGEYLIGAEFAGHVHGPNEQPAQPTEILEALLTSTANDFL